MAGRTRRGVLPAEGRKFDSAGAISTPALSPFILGFQAAKIPLGDQPMELDYLAGGRGIAVACAEAIDGLSGATARDPSSHTDRKAVARG